MLIGVVSIRGSDGGVAVDCGGLLKIEVFACAGAIFFSDPNGAEGDWVSGILPGCDILDDEDVVLLRNGFVKPGEPEEPEV